MLMLRDSSGPLLLFHLRTVSLSAGDGFQADPGSFTWPWISFRHIKRNPLFNRYTWCPIVRYRGLHRTLPSTPFFFINSFQPKFTARCPLIKLLTFRCNDVQVEKCRKNDSHGSSAASYKLQRRNHMTTTGRFTTEQQSKENHNWFQEMTIHSSIKHFGHEQTKKKNKTSCKEKDYASVSWVLSSTSFIMPASTAGHQIRIC